MNALAIFPTFISKAKNDEEEWWTSDFALLTTVIICNLVLFEMQPNTHTLCSNYSHLQMRKLNPYGVKWIKNTQHMWYQSQCSYLLSCSAPQASILKGARWSISNSRDLYIYLILPSCFHQVIQQIAIECSSAVGQPWVLGVYQWAGSDPILTGGRDVDANDQRQAWSLSQRVGGADIAQVTTWTNHLISSWRHDRREKSEQLWVHSRVRTWAWEVRKSLLKKWPRGDDLQGDSKLRASSWIFITKWQFCPAQPSCHLEISLRATTWTMYLQILSKNPDKAQLCMRHS